jgi:hypothetical protein
VRISGRPRTVLAVVLAVGGCVSSGGSPPEGADQLLIPDGDGRIDGIMSGTTGIEGAWFAYSDSTDAQGIPGGVCQANGHLLAQCSTVITPDPAAQRFPPTVVDGFIDLGMCVVGVDAQVISDSNGQPDFSHIWGLGIGMRLAAGQAYYDAPAHGVAGFAFDIDSEPPPGGGIRVQLPTSSTLTAAAWWLAATGDRSPVHAGHNEFHWDQVGGPTFSSSPPAFDPTHLLGILFQAVADTDGPKTLSFCIRNLTALGS